MRLADRSRYQRGTAECQRARYWEYEYKGIGIRSKADALPLATGKTVHEAIAQLMRVVKNEGHIPDRIFVRNVVRAAVELYQASCGKHGFQEDDIQGNEQIAWVVKEQATLIEGLVWAFYRSVLPWIVEEFEVVAVEQEIEFPLGCTCGLGDGVGGFADHDSRPSTVGEYEGDTGSCAGIGFMIRPDLVLRRRSDAALVVGEFKTNAYPGEISDSDHILQMTLMGKGVEKEFGEACTGHYLFGLYKGVRKADKGEKLKRQQSPLCYLYYRPADPPMTKEEYRAGYTRERGFGRVPTWQCFTADERGEASPVEYWVMDVMDAQEAGECVGINGPMMREVYLEEDILQEVLAEELDVLQKLEAMERGEIGLQQAFRRSWNCKVYGRLCPYLPLCKKEAGWDAPIESGKYEKREPHHTAEEEQKCQG